MTSSLKTSFPTRVSHSIDLNANATAAQTAIICAAAALLSCFVTGYSFGVSNQQFYLPIVERLYDEPQFKDDIFIQSLRYYSSGIWLAIGAGPKYGDGGYVLLALLFYLSRLLSFIGFVCCASLLGINTVRDRLIFCSILCFTVLLDGNSSAGHGGLFLVFFTHSEIANGTTLLAIYFAVRGRFTAALSWAGATFFVNGFMGAWLAPVLYLIAITLLRQRKIELRSLFRQAIQGAAVSALFVAPIIYNILANPELRTPIDFNYVAYLRESYGTHFLIESNSTEDILVLLAITCLGWLSLKRIGPSTIPFQAAFLAIVSIYIIGVFVPYVTPIPGLFKLHLLRSGAVIHLLTALGAGALTTQWLTSPERSRSTLLGPLLLLSICVAKVLLPLAAVVIAGADLWRTRQTSFALRPAVIASLALVIIPWHLWQRTKLITELNQAVADWQSVGSWAKSTTASDAVFLILTSSAASLEGKPEADVQRSLELTSAASTFQVASHRRVWVDFDGGSMVLLTPSYYHEWHRKITDVMALRNLPEKLKYAQENGVQYIVDDCAIFSDANIAPVFRSGDLCAAATS